MSRATFDPKPALEWLNFIHDLKNLCAQAITRLDLANKESLSQELRGVQAALKSYYTEQLAPLLTSAKNTESAAIDTDTIKITLAAKLQAIDDSLNAAQTNLTGEQKTLALLIQKTLTQASDFIAGKKPVAQRIDELARDQIAPYNNVTLNISSNLKESFVTEHHARLLQSILQNCIGNADSILAASGSPNPAITVDLRLHEATGKLQVEVSDNGPGMPKNIADKIKTGTIITTEDQRTQAASLARRASNGVGLPGLVHSIASMNGTLDIASVMDPNANHGTTVTFQLPAELVLEEKNVMTQTADVSANTDLIYFIDDVLVNVKLAKRVFNELIGEDNTAKYCRFVLDLSENSIPQQNYGRIVGMICDVNLKDENQNSVIGPNEVAVKIFPHAKKDRVLATYSGNEVGNEFADQGFSQAISKAKLKEGLATFLKTLHEKYAHIPVPTIAPKKVVSKSAISSAGAIQSLLSTNPPRKRITQKKSQPVETLMQSQLTLNDAMQSTSNNTHIAVPSTEPTPNVDTKKTIPLKQ